MPKKSKSLNALTLHTYADLKRFAQAFADGHLNLLILTGPPGVGKTRATAAAMPGACLVDGNTTAFGLYLRLWEGRDQPVVIDDVDGLHRDRSAVRLLKALCATEPIKTLAWNSDARTLASEDIPRRFTTTSKVAIIANDWSRLNIDVAALEDRGHVVHFDPSAIEVHTQAATWFRDQEVFDYVAAHLHLLEQPSFRLYVRAVELKQAGMDWRSSVLAMCLSGTLLVVAKLKADQSFPTEEERAKAFVAGGHGCRATYFNLAKKLRPNAEVPRIVLPPLEPATEPTPDIMDVLRKRWGQLGQG